MAEQCHNLVERYKMDMLFLDQIGLFINDPDCDFDTATTDYLHAIQTACPAIPLAGEIFQEKCRALPLWQMWGTPWCGLPEHRQLQPAFFWQDIFQHRFRTLAHMGMPAAVPVTNCWPAYYWFVDAYGPKTAARLAASWHERAGTIPCARLNYRNDGIDPIARSILLSVPEKD